VFKEDLSVILFRPLFSRGRAGYRGCVFRLSSFIAI